MVKSETQKGDDIMFGYTLISKKKLQQLKEENAGLRRYIEDIDKDIEELQKEMDRIKNRPQVDTSYIVGKVIE